MPPVCDLHIHSKYSDGVLPPEEIVKRASDKGLAAVAVTDHDTLGGQEEALAAGQKYGIEVIRGIEFSVMADGKGIHILGYLIELNHLEILESVEWLREKRLERFGGMLDRLEELGIKIGMDEVREYAGTDSFGRPHLAKLMLEKGLISHYQNAYSRYLGDGRPAYVAKEILPLKKVIRMIRDAGGVPVWAHPGGKVLDLERLKGMIALGLQGVEVWHPNHNYDLEHRIAALAAEYHLVPTGGSDFHFEEGMKVDIGGKHAPYSSVQRLRELADLS
ncbi:MAG: PHP domain-containing protein [Candidatus Latescibacteria bacterium]|nr:PHP domain-containing protein [bacterium]MBD3425387.1 PHP domain-containing protein [Candidatus Latescibacterota bacterium]